MAQAPDALGETIVADDATTRSKRVHDGLMTVAFPTDRGRRRIRPARTPRHLHSLQSQAVSSTTMLAIEVFV